MNRYVELLEKNKFEEAENLRKEKIPKKIYKFYFLSDDKKDNEKRFECLENDCIWMAPAYKMNDPYEYKCMYLDEVSLKHYGYPKELIDAYNRIFGSMIRDVYLTSFTENDENFLPMWAYYSNNYQGYCVEYKVIDPQYIYKICYEPQRIPIAKIATDIYDGIVDMIEGNPDNDKLKFNTILLMQQFFLKHKSWEHEKEYRIVVPLENPPKDGCRVNIEKLGLKVEKIYSGINCNYDNIEKLNKISNYLGCGNVVQLKTSDAGYMLVST